MTRLRQLLTHIMSNTEQNKLQFYGFTAARSARALKKEDSAMNEKIYNTMRTAGTAGIVVGIVTIATGVATGVLMIIHGAKLLRDQGKMMI